MIDDQLAAAAEEIAERLLSRRRIEHVILLDLDPGEGAPFSAELVAGLGPRLLLGKMRLARRDPLVPAYDGFGVCCADETPWRPGGAKG